jgi:hypothetical protein
VIVQPGESFIGGGIGRVVEGDGGEGLVVIKTEGFLCERQDSSLAVNELEF